MPGWTSYKNYLLLGQTEDWSDFAVAYPIAITGATVTAAIISSETGSTIQSLLSGASVNFEAGVSKTLQDMGAAAWKPTAAAKSAVLRLQISGGAPAVASFDNSYALPVIDFPATTSVIEGDTTDGAAGVYHEAATDEVKLGTAFGPASAYTGTYASPVASVSLIVDAATYTVGDTVTVTGGVTSDQNVTGATVTLRRKKRSDGSTIATLINTTANLVASVQKTWAAILGAACTFTPATAQDEYLEASVSGGTPSITSETAGRCGYAVRPAAGIAISMARVNGTTVRMTITGATGTVRSFYALTTASSWTAGGTRSGNGTIDITVTEGAQYYYAALDDTGSYSQFSMIVKFTSTNPGGGSVVSLQGFPRLLEPQKVIRDTPDETVISAKYALGTAADLDTLNMEVGDSLPAPLDDYEIISVAKSKMPGTNVEMATVQARLSRPWEDSGP